MNRALTPADRRQLASYGAATKGDPRGLARELAAKYPGASIDDIARAIGAGR